MGWGQNPAANEDIPHFYVRNIGMPNIIGVLARSLI
jgi:hypothetical protein